MQKREQMLRELISQLTVNKSEVGLLTADMVIKCQVFSELCLRIRYTKKTVFGCFLEFLVVFLGSKNHNLFLIASKAMALG